MYLKQYLIIYCISKNMYIMDIQEHIEDDYHISSFFPSEIQYNLHPLIEYRIKLLLKHNVVIHSGESQKIETVCILNKKLSKLSLMLKSYEHLPVVFESEGAINSKFNGRIKVTLTNYSIQNVKMSAGAPVGYLILQPYSLK